MPLLEMERPRPESRPGVGRPPTTGRAFLVPLRPERARLAALACRRRTPSEFCPRLLAAGTPPNALSPPRQLYRIADAHAPPACVRLHWAQDERASQPCRGAAGSDPFPRSASGEFAALRRPSSPTSTLRFRQPDEPARRTVFSRQARVQRGGRVELAGPPSRPAHRTITPRSTPPSIRPHHLSGIHPRPAVPASDGQTTNHAADPRRVHHLRRQRGLVVVLDKSRRAARDGRFVFSPRRALVEVGPGPCIQVTHPSDQN